MVQNFGRVWEACKVNKEYEACETHMAHEVEVCEASDVVACMVREGSCACVKLMGPQSTLYWT